MRQAFLDFFCFLVEGIADEIGVSKFGDVTVKVSSDINGDVVGAIVGDNKDVSISVGLDIPGSLVDTLDIFFLFHFRS